METVYFESEDVARRALHAVAESAARIANSESQWVFYSAVAWQTLTLPDAKVTTIEVRDDESTGVHDAFSIVRLQHRPGTFSLLAYVGATDETRVMTASDFATYGVAIP